MIPKSFRLINRQFVVQKLNKSVADAGSMEGDFSMRTGIIRVGSAGNDEYNSHTFYHELVHALLESSSKPSLSKKEAFVDSLAAVLHQYEQTKKGEL